MDIKNIKIHCSIKKKYLHSHQISFDNPPVLVKKSFPSFKVIRLGRFTYTCFRSGHINISGIPVFDDIDIAIHLLNCRWFPEKEQINYTENTTIDNITSKYPSTIKKHISLTNLKTLVVRLPEVQRVKYNRETFPCMFIKTSYGTIIYSAKNSIASVGCKSQTHLHKIFNLIYNITGLL